MKYKNIFVLCSGRCGSVSLAHALSHAENFSVGHESRMATLGPERLHYPDAHIEIDNRLTFMLGPLHARFGDAPLYVHLLRDPAACAASYAKRFRPGLLMFAWARGIHVGLEDTLDLEAVARNLVDTMNENIRLFLRERPHTLNVTVEQFPHDVTTLWQTIGAEGDLAAAIESLASARNQAPPEVPEALERAFKTRLGQAPDQA
jgi:hypothetical protein